MIQTTQITENKFTLVQADKTPEQLALELYETSIGLLKEKVDLLEDQIKVGNNFYVMEAEGVYLTQFTEENIQVMGILHATVFRTAEEAQKHFGNIMNGNRVLFVPRQLNTELIHQIKQTIKQLEQLERTIEGKKPGRPRKTAVESMKEEMTGKELGQIMQETSEEIIAERTVQEQAEESPF